MTQKGLICNKCGKCCYLEKDNIRKKCPYLKELSNGKTFCKSYKNRINRYIGIINGTKFYCGYRINLPKKITDCPYNSLIMSQNKEK